MNQRSTAEQLRRLYPRVLGKTLALTRSLPDAEDAVQDAMARALEHWPRSGPPRSAEGWLVAVAANVHRDRIRHARRVEQHRCVVASLAEQSPWLRIAMGELDVARGWKDELLGLLFACCHPVLEPGESAALALATVIGLSNDELARAFVVAPRSMEQRLARARQRLRERGDHEGIDPERAHDRIAAVLATIYLLFNEGYWSGDDATPIRADLCRLAIGLARSLAAVFVDEPEVAGLLALLLLLDGRRSARLDQHGVAIPLPEQDRSRWDRTTLDEGIVLLEQALQHARPGPFQIEAAIAAVHARALRAEDTDWSEIAALYALLERSRPTPTVRVNRAYAVARAAGPSAGLALLDERSIDAADHPYVALVRGSLLAELGSIDAARAELERARTRARNRREAEQIADRIARLVSPPVAGPASGPARP